MEAGTNERIKIVKFKGAHSKTRRLDSSVRFLGLASLAARSPFVCNVQNGRETIYRPAVLGSCLSKTHSLVEPQSRYILI